MATLSIEPGIVATPTDAKNSVSWQDANLVRWDENVMSPIGGWERLGYSVPASRIVRTHQWRDNTGNIWNAYLCEEHVYVEHDGDLLDISPTPALAPPDDNYVDGGYGDGNYDEDEYGTPRAPNPDRKKFGPAYTLQNWGENLLIMSSNDGRLLEWVPDIAAPAACEVVLNAPTGNRCFIVTPERHVMVMQAGGDPTKYAWCDEEDNTNWDFGSLTSKAGFYNIEPAEPIVSAASTEFGNLIFSASRVHISTHVGLPFVYDKDILYNGAAVLSPGLVASVNGAEWMTGDGIWRFNGASIAPEPCGVWPILKDAVDWERARYTGNTVLVSSKSEIWYFLPGVGETKNTLAAIHNFKSGWWSMARIPRTCGFDSGNLPNPIMADEYKVYKHESGDLYADYTGNWWLESYTFNNSGGTTFGTVRQVEPEVKGDYSGVRFSLATKTKRTPYTKIYSPQRSVQSNGFVDFMVKAKDFRLRIESIVPHVAPVTIGDILIDAVPGGKR